MTDALQPYALSILALGVLGLLYVGQLLVADVTGILRRHTPGTSVPGDHSDFFFRAVRAHANTTESLGAVILLAAFAILRGGDPTWVNGTIGFVVLCRLGHTLSYYLDLKLFRSAVFGFGIAALVALFVVGLVTP